MGKPNLMPWEGRGKTKPIEKMPNIKPSRNSEITTAGNTLSDNNSLITIDSRRNIHNNNNNSKFSHKKKDSLYKNNSKLPNLYKPKSALYN